MSCARPQNEHHMPLHMVFGGGLGKVGVGEPMGGDVHIFLHAAQRKAGREGPAHPNRSDC
jgi:hypothetical protein